MWDVRYNSILLQNKEKYKYKNLWNIKERVLACVYLPIGVTDTGANAETVTVYFHLHATLLQEVISSDWNPLSIGGQALLWLWLIKRKNIIIF